MSYRKSVTYTLLLALFLLSASNVTPLLSLIRAETIPKVFPDPKTTFASIDVAFSVKINVSDVEDLCSWQVYIYFLSQIIQAKNCTEGSFLKSQGTTIFDQNVNNAFNSTHGQLWMYCLRTWSGSGVSGSGTLATMTFESAMAGTSPLIFSNTILGNSTAQRIVHTTENGIVEVGGHDIAVVSVVRSKNVVLRDYPVRTNATIQNQGNYTETFTVKAYANMTIFDIKNINLLNASSITLTFTLNTVGWAKGNYTVKIVADTIQGETDVADNNFTDGWIFVAMLGDLTCDGQVDIVDVAMVAFAFGSSPGKPRWDPICDINDDAIVDIVDVATVAFEFGKTDP